eukprot:CAMPEP_0174260426 /NCGR_PEP_ID=MMETSP0439-20130205/9706_1 /TAXON_ID=0 /ORGANISM="Stereomyxa ramosa, Strain Chinc5" /LENGTH=194 /DNA_ID=CAMNT_0015344671 /DNA_START=28 /DNA_END=615 /DNA_ORIENTATION=-
MLRRAACVPRSGVPFGRCSGLFGLSQNSVGVPDYRSFSGSSLSFRDVIVEEAGAGTFINRVKVGNEWSFLMDEPPGLGGNDLGPNPYDILLAALGSCTTMTMRMYANKKGIPLQKTKILLKHNKIWAKDCETCVNKEGKVDKIERELFIYGDKLTEEQRKDLARVADKCPVHQTLTSTDTIITTTVAGRLAIKE